MRTDSGTSSRPRSGPPPLRAPLNLSITNGQRPIYVRAETSLGFGNEAMHEERRPRAETDPRSPYSFSNSFTIQDLLNRVIQTGVRTCLNYPLNDREARFKPPSAITALDIDRRKIKTMVVAVDNVQEHWWRVSAAIAAMCGLPPSEVRTLNASQVPYQDFLAAGSSAYAAALNRGEVITYCQIAVTLDWRKVFGIEGYRAINSRKKWMAAVAGVEEMYAAKAQFDLDINPQGSRKGMFDYNTIRNDSTMEADLSYLLYTQKKDTHGRAPTVKWTPGLSLIHYT